MAIAGKVAILPKGEWNSAVRYEKLDAVSYDNALYIAKKPSVGQVPTDGEYWMFCLQSIDYAEFEKIINGTTTVGIADKAINDKNGYDIVDTYAKKNDLTNFQNKDGDSKDNIVTFTSADDTTSDAWTDVAILTTGEKHSSLFAKISTMFKNIRYIYTHFIKSENILDTLEEIVANTQSEKVAGALAVKELNSSLTNIYDVTSELQYRYCREVSGRNKLIKCGNMMFLTVVVITTTALTNSENYIIKIPKKYLPKQSVYGAIQTNAYSMDVIPFAVSAIDDWNVWLSYQKLNNQTIPTDRWLWGTISWIIGG